MAIRSGILSFGLVAIPVKVYPATRDQAVRFNLIHKKCGNRVQNQWFCPVDNEVVPREDLVRGAEVSKDRYVQITDQELEALEAEANRSIDLNEFVPLESVDPVYFCIGILNHLFFWPEQYRRTGGMSIVFLFDENPDVASAGSGGAAVGGARSVPDHAARSNSERAAPSAPLATGFRLLDVWNKSNRCAGERGGPGWAGPDGRGF